MADQRSVMKEFRSLDAKRAAGGLTPAEETRYAHLRDLIGPEMGAGSLSPGFDVDAAAAQLRDSLLPAGLRNRPPPAPPRLEAEPADTAAAGALVSASSPEPAFEAGLDSSFEPGALSPEAPYEPSLAAGEPAQPAWDPDAGFDPGAGAQGWDPSAQPYDPNAPPYDPSAQPYDPTAPPYDPSAQPYDPNAPYDPSAQPYDPNAPYDPSAQPYDPNALPYDANAQPYDPSAPPYDASAQPYDPSAPQSDEAGQPYPEGAPLDSSAQPWDAAQGQDDGANAGWDAGAAYDADVPAAPGALAYDLNASPEAGGQAYPAPDATATDETDALAEPGSAMDGFLSDSGAAALPDGWTAEPAPDVPSEGQLEAAAPAGEDGGLESLLPFDPAAAAAIAPGEVPNGFGSALGEYDDTAGFRDRHPDAAPADLPLEEPGFQAAQSVAQEEIEPWHPDPAVLEEDFELASGGSFVATADAAAPEWAGGTPAPPWDREGARETAGDATAAAADEAAFDAAAVEPAADGVESIEDLAPLDTELAEPLEPGPGASELAEPQDDSAILAEDLAAQVETPAESAAAGAGHALDFSRPDFSADSPEEDAFVFAAMEPTAAAAAHAEASLDASAEPAAGAAPLDFEPAEATREGGEEAHVELGAIPEIDEDIPTIDGEEILEEIVELPPGEAEGASAEPAPRVPDAPDDVLSPATPAAAAAVAPALATAAAPPSVIAAPPPAAEAPPPAAAVAPQAPPVTVEPAPAQEAAPSFRVPGVHRVVVHTVEGQAKRGVLEDIELAGETLALAPQQGAAAEVVPSEKVKAIFFMLAPGEKAPAPEGRKVRVTFRDGRQVAGFSPDYSEEGVGFFMIPADTRTNTGRIWVYRSAVRQVSVS